MKCVKIENGVVVNSAIWNECPDGWIESDEAIGSTYSGGVFTAPASESTVDEAEQEYYWAKNQLSLADIEINKHLDSDENAIATEEEWRTYRKELRAYAAVSDGVYSYSGERPTAPE